jgi:hypothetical protein
MAAKVNRPRRAFSAGIPIEKVGAKGQDATHDGWIVCEAVSDRAHPRYTDPR